MTLRYASVLTLLLYCGSAVFLNTLGWLIAEEEGLGGQYKFREKVFPDRPIIGNVLGKNVVRKGSKEQGQIGQVDMPTFSACLNVKDDNLVLPEWIAYHYTVAPLRRLVVAVDKHSLTSPQTLLQAFNTALPDLTISLWNDSDFLPHAKGLYWRKYNTSDDASPGEKHRFFLFKQLAFYNHCAKVLRSENRTWTMLLDSDEYAGFHDRGNQRPARGFQQCCNFPGRRCRKNGSPVDVLKAFNVTFRKKERLSQFLQRHVGIINTIHNSTQSNGDDTSCIYIPRTMHGAKEVEDNRTRQNDVTMTTATAQNGHKVFPLDPRGFRTLRYPFHDYIQNKHHGKSFLNVASPRFQPGGIDNPHIAQMHTCYNAAATGRSTSVDASYSFFLIHHYTGSPKEFLARPGDPTRTMEAFVKRNVLPVYDRSTEESMQWWLGEFVQQVGSDKAKKLFDLKSSV